MAPLQELQNRYYGAPGTPERKEYERGHHRDVNKLLVGHMLKRIKANARPR